MELICGSMELPKLFCDRIDEEIFKPMLLNGIILTITVTVSVTEREHPDYL